ncbi:MAG: hypothetical protein ACRCTJ_03200, partial [Brevinema sp.]
PSTILFFDALILTPDLREWIPLLNKFEEKLDHLLMIINPIAGWLTLIIALVHAFFAHIIFL